MNKEVIIIHGQTPSHKNSKVWTGRLLINNKLYLRWRGGAEIDVLNQCKVRYIDCVEVQMTFFVKDKRLRDLDNMVASVLDVLAKSTVIRDDNVFVVRGIHAYFGGIDRANPRAEVEICDLGKASSDAI
jgi:Holliday junction resolvase RusA-like endonuclease